MCLTSIHEHIFIVEISEHKSYKKEQNTQSTLRFFAA